MKTARKPPSERPASTDGAKFNRSRVTNGSTLHLGHVNGCTAQARRFRDLVSAFLDEAGLTTPTEAQIGLCRRCAAATCELERLEEGIARGEPIDRLEYSRLDGVLRRNRRTLGIEPTAPADDEPEDRDDLLEREGFARVTP